MDKQTDQLTCCRKSCTMISWPSMAAFMNGVIPVLGSLWHMQEVHVKIPKPFTASKSKSVPPDKVTAQSVIMLDIFHTGIRSIRWQKWFTETSQIMTVTSWLHGCPYCC